MAMWANEYWLLPRQVLSAPWAASWCPKQRVGYIPANLEFQCQPFDTARRFRGSVGSCRRGERASAPLPCTAAPVRGQDRVHHPSMGPGDISCGPEAHASETEQFYALHHSALHAECQLHL